MTGSPIARLHRQSIKSTRAFDLAQRPRRDARGRPSRRRRGPVRSETPDRRRVRVANMASARSQMSLAPRRNSPANQQAISPSHAMGDAGLRRIGPRLGFAQEGRGVLPHRCAARLACSCRPTDAVSRGETLGRVVVRPTPTRGALAKAAVVSWRAEAACDHISAWP